MASPESSYREPEGGSDLARKRGTEMAQSSMPLSREEIALQAKEAATLHQFEKRAKESEAHVAQIKAVLSASWGADMFYRMNSRETPSGYIYSVNDPSRVIIDQLGVSDRVLSTIRMDLGQLVDLVEALSDEAMKARMEMALVRDKFREEREARLTAKQASVRNLERSITEARQSGGDTVYADENGRYYPSNPTRVPLGTDQIRQIPYVTPVPLDRAKDRLDRLNVPTKESVLAKLDAGIDALGKKMDARKSAETTAGETGKSTPSNSSVLGNLTGRLDASRDENLRKYLMGVRVGLSGMSANQIVDVVPDPMKSLGRILQAVDTPMERIGPQDALFLAWDVLNVGRFGASDTMANAISIARDVSTNRLHKMGEDSDADKALKQTLDTSELPPFLRDMLFDFGKGSFAVAAGGMDGTLDYLQSAVDAVTIPDKVVQNAMNTLWTLGGAVIRDNQAFFSGVGRVISENVKNPSDVAYIVSYIAAIVACIALLPPPAGLLAVPIYLANLCTKFGLGEAIQTKIIQAFESAGVAKNIEGRVAKEAGHRAERVGMELSEKGFDQTSNAETGLKRLGNNAEKAAELARADALIRAVTSTQVLTNLFGKEILPRISNQPNAQAMTAEGVSGYVSAILAPNGYHNLDQLADAVSKTDGETQYDLLRTYERFVEVKEVLEKEVMPVAFEMNRIDAAFDVVAAKRYQNEVRTKLPSMSPLGSQIVARYFLDR